MVDLAFKLDLRKCGTHRIGVQLELDSSLLPVGPIELFQPVWTPGSYVVREFARHLEGFGASDTAGDAPLAWHKTAKNRFLVDRSDGGVRVSYSVYGHELSVRTADFTDDHAFWVGAAVCLWPVGLPNVGATFEIDLPAGWTLESPLRRVQGPMTRLVARDLDEVVDSPVLAGDLTVQQFEVLGVPHRFVFDGLAGVEPPASLITDTAAVITQAAAVFGGELPYQEYRLLSMFTDAGRGGLEHSACCTLLASRTTFLPAKSYHDFMGLVAHEHFHAWNIKRMRPRSLWSYDYERENYTDLLWVVEGMTAYYDDLLCLRAGVVGANRYFELVGEHVTAMHAAPGRLVHSLSAASFDAWIKLYRPDENSRNSTQSYYTHGALAMMCFDLTIRAATRGARSLDDAVTDLYRRTFIEARGYDTGDVITSLSTAAGKDMAELVGDLVDGPFDPDFDEIFAPFGLRLTTSGSGAPYFGLQFRGSELTISSVLRDSPAMRAGLSPGDELLALDGLRVRRANWASLVRNAWSGEGQTICVLIARRGRILERVVQPDAHPIETWRVEPVGDATPEQERLREAWLGPRSLSLGGTEGRAADSRP